MFSAHKIKSKRSFMGHPGFRRFGRRLIQTFKAANALAIATTIAISPVAHALDVHLKKDLKVRTLVDNQMERVGLLAAGSVVEIPDSYKVLNARGDVDPELTLNNWLSKAGYQAKDIKPTKATYDGERTDFFFPVKIKHAAPGSETKYLNGKTHYMALRHLIRENGALIVDTPATLRKSPSAEDLTPLRSISEPLAQPESQTDQESQAPSQDPGELDLEELLDEKPAKRKSSRRQRPSQQTHESHSEAGLTCEGGGCSPEATVAPGFDRLKRDLRSIIKSVDSRTATKALNTIATAEALPSNFENSCGISFNSFKNEIKRIASREGLPSEILFSMMTQESSGKCFILNSEANNTTSVGLFQVSSRTSHYSRCTSSQKETLRSLSTLAEMKNGPQCLENPVVNLKEAVRILKSKLNEVTREDFRVSLGERYEGFDRSRLKNRDGEYTDLAWRLAISAYNGGERWPLRAKYDLEQFNRKHGTELSPYNWEHLRVFYLRRGLDRVRNGHSKHFSDTRTGRSIENSVSNLAYAENMVPRQVSARPSGQRSLGQYWKRELDN